MTESHPNANWRQLVARLLKAEMSRRGVKYQELSTRLASIGVIQSADNLRNKVNRGIMGADLLLQLMYVLKMKPVSADEIEDLLADLNS